MKTRRMNGNTLEICEDSGEAILAINESITDGTMVITLKGKLQNDVCYEFEDELMSSLLVCNKVRIDFSEVTYVASKALNSLLSAQRIVDEKDNAELVICKVSEKVMDVFNESGFSDILMIEE